MYHLVWQDYDGVRVEALHTKADIEERLSELLQKKKEDYGFSIDLLVKGNTVTYETVEVVKKVKLKA